MNVLAFTTSTDHGSVALAQEGRITAMTQWTRKSHGSEILTYKIKNLLTKAKLSPHDLNIIAVDKGPGSFTGCRIAANVAKTLAMTLNLPLAAEYSLDIMASGALAKSKTLFTGRILCLLDAHKSLFYARTYRCQDSKIIEFGGSVQALSLDEIAERKKQSQLIVDHKHFPHAKGLALMAINTKVIDWRFFEPTYVRSPEAVEKRNALRPAPDSL